jgi:uncharacterized membrane protein
MTDNKNWLPIPNAGGAYSEAWKIMKANFLELFLIVILLGLFSMPIWYYSRYNDYTGNFDFVSYMFWLAYTSLIYLPLIYGMLFAFLKAVREEKVRATDIFRAYNNFWNAVLGNILVGTIVGLGFALILIPGIFFLSKLSFVPYYIVDKNMEVIEALKASWANTKGFTSRIFLIYLLAAPIFLIGAIFFGIGTIISLMWVNTTMAYFYYTVDINSHNIQAINEYK